MNELTLRQFRVFMFWYLIERWRQNDVAISGLCAALKATRDGIPDAIQKLTEELKTVRADVARLRTIAGNGTCQCVRWTFEYRLDGKIDRCSMSIPPDMEPVDGFQHWWRLSPGIVLLSYSREHQCLNDSSSVQ